MNAIESLDSVLADPRVPPAPAMRIRDVRAAVAELVAADRELDAAQDAVCDAKREKGNWRVNPLRFDHPAVLRVRAAKIRRAAALASVTGVTV